MALINNEKGLVLNDTDPIESCFNVCGCTMTIKNGIPYEMWAKKFSQLRELNGRLLWFLGDMVIYAEDNYGDRCYQAFDELDYDIQTIRNAAWVAGRIPPSRRRECLSWSHHEAVAALDEKRADKWLDIAERERYSRSDLRNALKSEDGSKVLEAPSVQLLTLFTSLRIKAEEVFKAMPPEKWDPELLIKMKETFYGTVYDIENLTGWERSTLKREYKPLKGKNRVIST